MSARAPAPEVAEALHKWGFNVMLECDGRDDEKLEVVIGGAILDLRDLHLLLTWARSIAAEGAAA